MNLIPNAIYELSGEDFNQQDLTDNDRKFKFIGEDGEYWLFTGVKNGTPQYAKQEWVDAETAIIKLVKTKRAKRKKGERNKAPSVNKATILFMSGETYTLKDFVSIEATAESVVFIMEDNWKGTVNYRQAITVPNDDVAEVKVRGVNHQFVLDMTLTNMGIVVLQAEGAEIHSSSINMIV